MHCTQRVTWWSVILLTGLVLSACGTEQPTDEEETTPAEGEFLPPLEDLDTLLDGAPDNAELPSENKADQSYPAQFDVVDTQSPVSNQGSRGVCSVFSTVGLMEHLYIKEGTVSDPQFSEQYLQWAAKFEAGSFPDSSGSNARYNLEAISDHGVVEESLWAYESSPWSAQDDEECQGEDRPTRCFTNGHPPQEAEDAPRFRLPSGRWISTRTDDIKSHIHNRQEAVVVGGDFYYQAWNHGASELTTNAEYLRNGYVLYPNDADKEYSRQNRAGHSILLVGWDDELEVERRDGDGEVMVDADGEPVTEQGFFIFKNSWGTGGFGANNPHGDGYGFISYDYVEEFNSGRVAATPEPQHIPDPIEPLECSADELECDGVCVPINADNCGACGNRCGADAICEDATCVDHQAELYTYEWDGDSVVIPDDDPEGVQVEITVDEPGEIKELTSEVWIEHTYNGDIELELTAPDGETVELREADGSSGWDIIEEYDVDAFRGTDVEGTWQLHIADRAHLDEGSLIDWYLHILH